MKKSVKKKFGQYFTPGIVADFMISIASIRKNDEILEPCCGDGIFLERLHKNSYKKITAYEIDNSLSNRFSSQVIFESFIASNIEKKFDLIIGNPPYIRWKHLEED